MDTAHLAEWMDARSDQNCTWYVKRLSGNDTLANGSHQAGPYIPKDLLFSVFNELNKPEIKNPDIQFDIYIDSHAEFRTARAIWYNNRLHDNPKSGRNETRVTGFGGSSSALLDPNSTGAIAVFAFPKTPDGPPFKCHVWVCTNASEEDLVEDRVGPIEPGKGITWPPKQYNLIADARRSNCWLETDEIPKDWLIKFPSGIEIIRKSIELRGDRQLPVDKRIIERRKCEFEIFRSVEQAFELPNILAGFSSIDNFISRAQTILQRRKARSGRSLELHTKAIFIEEQMIEGKDFSHQPESEPGKKPDFLFPSATAYRDSSFPSEKLRMLAVKTTCKDRWRQILNEADRIPSKHLLTLQEGVSENQFREMLNSDVKLVVPSGIIKTYAKSVQPHLISLNDFIKDVKQQNYRS